MVTSQPWTAYWALGDAVFQRHNIVNTKKITYNQVWRKISLFYNEAGAGKEGGGRGGRADAIVQRQGERKKRVRGHATRMAAMAVGVGCCTQAIKSSVQRRARGRNIGSFNESRPSTLIERRGNRRDTRV